MQEEQFKSRVDSEQTVETFVKQNLVVGGEKRRNIIKTVKNPLSENKPRKTESVTD